MSFKVSGSFDRTMLFLRRMRHLEAYDAVESLAQEGTAALAASTPEDSGVTAASWYHEILDEDGYFKIRWYNTSVNDGAVIVILLQYGHGTGTGGYVEGQDFINPAIRPVFDRIENEVWKKVTSA